MHLVITACTNRKRARASLDLRAAALPRGALTDVAQAWIRRLEAADERLAACRLYAGRGFQEAIGAAEDLGANLAVVSAGLGLVGGDENVPPYALSVVDGSTDGVLRRLTDGSNAAHWWRELTRVSPFGQSLARTVASSTGIVLVALSETYLSMIVHELKALPPADATRLRIVTRTPIGRVDAALRDRLMPYDDRLDGPDSTLRGTRGDFAARAARHFARNVIARDPAASASEHMDAVVRSMSGWRLPPTLERIRHDDNQLLEILRENWDRAGGQSTKLLRVLRDDLNIACEQGRFVGLMKRLREERKLAA